MPTVLSTNRQRRAFPDAGRERKKLNLAAAQKKLKGLFKYRKGDERVQREDRELLAVAEKFLAQIHGSLQWHAERKATQLSWDEDELWALGGVYACDRARDLKDEVYVGSSNSITQRMLEHGDPPPEARVLYTRVEALDAVRSLEDDYIKQVKSIGLAALGRWGSAARPDEEAKHIAVALMEAAMACSFRKVSTRRVLDPLQLDEVRNLREFLSRGSAKGDRFQLLQFSDEFMSTIQSCERIAAVLSWPTPKSVFSEEAEKLGDQVYQLQGKDDFLSHDALKLVLGCEFVWTDAVKKSDGVEEARAVIEKHLDCRNTCYRQMVKDVSAVKLYQRCTMDALAKGSVSAIKELQTSEIETLIYTERRTMRARKLGGQNEIAGLTGKREHGLALHTDEKKKNQDPRKPCIVSPLHAA